MKGAQSKNINIISDHERKRKAKMIFFLVSRLSMDLKLHNNSFEWFSLVPINRAFCLLLFSSLFKWLSDSGEQWLFRKSPNDV